MEVRNNPGFALPVNGSSPYQILEINPDIKSMDPMACQASPPLKFHDGLHNNTNPQNTFE